METKHLTTRAVLKADGDDGVIEAVFSTFNVLDRGGDIVLPGAIEHGKEVPMVWAHDWSKIVGKGTTEVTPERAVYKGQFFLDTAAGMDAYRTVKNMGALQEFSWGFLIKDAAYEQRDGESVRLIKSTEMFEVSPVLVGEGRGTGTLALKYGQPFDEQCDTALAAVTHIVERWKSLADSIVKEGRPISESRRGRMGSIAEQLDAASADLRSILKETEPAKSFDIDIDAMFAAMLVEQGIQMGAITFMNALTEKKARVALLQKQWNELYAAKQESKDWTAEEASQLKQWFDEANDLGEEIKTLETLAAMSQDMQVKGGRPIVDDEPQEKAFQPEPKSIEERIRESAGLKAFVEKGRGTFPIAELSNAEVKTLITLSDGAPQNTRLPRMEPYPVERRTVEDMFARGTMDGNVIEYYEETTFTNAAAETAEGTAKPEAALDWTLRTETASKIAVWIPATTESLQDISWLRSTIENRLVFMLQRRKEAQLLNGNGTTPNISGITDRSGLQTQAKGADAVPDAILKAANLVRVNAFYEPDGVVINPLDMEAIRLLKTADGIYIFGSPSDPYTAMRLWGMEVRETTAQTENTAIVGAFGTAAQVFYRTGVTITASTEHASYFIENKVAILAEQRLALAVYRPNAFATVTGI